MENIKHLQKLAEVFDTDKIITSDEIEQVLKGILVIMNSFKKDNQNLNKETKEVVNNLYDKIINEHNKLQEYVTRETSDTKNEVAQKIEKSLNDIKSLIAEVKELKPKDGIDGKDADEERIIDDILAKIKLPEYDLFTLEEKGDEIVEEINSLPTDKDEYKIDASHIKNLPQQITYRGGVMGIKEIVAGSNITVDNSNPGYPVISSTGGGTTLDLEVEGTPNVDQTLLNLIAGANMTITDNGDGSVTFDATGGGTVGPGTINEIAYFDTTTSIASLSTATYPSLTELSYVKGLTSALQTQLNAKLTSSNIVETITNGVTTNAPSENAVFDALALKEPLKGADDNYVTDAQLIVIGNTSGTNTGDQDLSTLAPKTSPTFATSITGSYLTVSEILITDGSKNIVSAPVATYPSLTELTYLKGVTSAIQTQLNAKQASDTQLTSLAALTYAGNGGKFIRLNAGETDFEFAASGGGTVDGSGTTNELTYWVDADTLGALAVATYPSLTELAYVKGVTSAIQTQLNAKQASGSYLTSANIVETITNGVTTNAPSENAVFDALALKAPLTSPTFATSVTGSYLTASEMLITDASKNIVSAAVATYPSLTELTYLKGVTSAIQTQLGTKAPSASPTFTGTVILPKTLEIQDTTGDHQYVLAVSELIADRTVTLPLLTTADEFVFKDHAVTLTNKTIALGSNTVSGTKAQFNTACTDGNFIFEGDAVSAASTSGVSAGPASSSTQTITHGLGKTPSIIRIHGIGEMQSSSNSRTPSVSHGTYNSTGNRCIRMQGGQGTFAPATSTTYAVYLEEMTVAGVATGVVQNVGATTFDIVWTLTGTDVSDTTAFLWEAE